MNVNLLLDQATFVGLCDLKEDMDVQRRLISYHQLRLMV